MFSYMDSVFFKIYKIYCSVLICKKCKSKYECFDYVKIDVIVNNTFAVTTIAVEGTVTDVNDPPTFPNPPYTWDVSEKISTNSFVGQITAVDPDSPAFAVVGYAIGEHFHSFIAL